MVTASVAFLTTTSAVAGPGRAETCTAARGAVVAVDFGPFGGDVVRGCDPAPTTGYDLLHEGGFGTAGTEHDGPAFICRIGHGSFNGGARYPTPAQEDCVLTPPANAYWSYWTASPGQDDWSYSRYGAMDRRLKDGDVDAWVYGGTGRPDFSPDDVRPGTGGTPGPGTPTGAPGAIDVAAAADWLESRLTEGDRVVPEGGDTPDHLLTTEVAYGLAAAGSGPALRRVTAFLTSHAGEYAYPEGTGGAPDATAAARLALLASSTEADPRDVGGHDLIRDLSAHVCAAGPESGEPTPGCTARGDFRNAGYTDGQALSVLALLRAGVTPAAEAVRRLTQVQCRDGGVTGILIRPGEYCDGDPATTALVALVLHRAGGHDDAVAKARAYLAGAQRQDGSFPGYTGATTGAVHSTAYAAQALRVLGDGDRADAAVAWLSREQLAGGGFGFEEGATDPALYPTPAAVLAGTGASLVTLTTERTGPTDPPTSPPPATQPPTSPPPATQPPTSPPPATDPVTPPEGDGPDLAKGVAYLTGAALLKQGRYYTSGPGSVRADFGLTIDGAYALAATGLSDGRLRGIVDFLDNRGTDGEGRTLHDWTGIGTPHVLGGSLGKTALLAETVGRDPRHFGGQDLVAALGRSVCAGPSTAPDRSCAAKGAYTYTPSVFGQSLAVMAQLRAGETGAAREPLAYLTALQRDDGAWPSLVPATDDSDVDSTAIAAMALSLADGSGADRAVDRALAWIASQQLPDGGFPGAAGNSVNSAALAVQGLSLDASAYTGEIARARAFLASQQNPDGGFNVARDGQRGSDLRASAQAVSGATGISFGTLERDLSGTSPQPTPGPGDGGPEIVIPETVTPGGTGGAGAPDIVTPGGPGGGYGASGGEGALASTGARARLLAVLAALMVLAGWRCTVLARRRAPAGSDR
nr:prenyltransferase/squalene oxidase repeat-containing protein [Streptomyces sp. SID8352]